MRRDPSRIISSADGKRSKVSVRGDRKSLKTVVRGTAWYRAWWVGGVSCVVLTGDMEAEGGNACVADEVKLAEDETALVEEADEEDVGETGCVEGPRSAPVPATAID